MSDIQDEAYSEAMDEIDKLKGEIARLKKLNLMTDDEVILDLKSEIERLKAQIVRLKANRMAAFSTDELRLIAGGLCKMFIGLVPNCRLLEDVNSEVDRRNYELRKAVE
jgi:uncharacterized small protein (DUF1192 family)